MARSQDAKTLRCEFERSYELSRSPILRELERSICGCDYGATSWTSRAEAHRMADHLRLGPGVQLLEVGAGAGWPGLYLAQLTGCDVTLADVPFTGLRLASGRASEDRLDEQVRIVAADGARLPFRDGAFAAVSHSDVLCCMPAKLDMLRECRRIAHKGASMAFSVIALSPDLSEPERKIALEGSPPFVEAPAEYSVLLGQSGWRLVERTDVTAEFARALRALLHGMRSRAVALTELLGPEEFAEREEYRQAGVTATSRGLLRRELFVATVSD